ncbi:Ig-like domain-containing protein [Flavobacterium sp.]|uniref:Ig-like domain-containing protein n=1 Tax=Flavobacterium sp. TaxID=239 RepID=UPI002602A6BD|nr:Ig-like domain-containing protein [Flavobacterium sp.]
MKKQICYFFLFSLLVITGCAKRGSISGGLKDTIAPVLEVSFPKNYSTDFKGTSIKLTFDEYVKLKDINKQLIISPPIAKKPQILPLTASKTVTVNFLEALEPNTTYSLNFGQSIEDNNEGNPYRQFKYVFSTGAYIDSLSISGNIRDALDRNADTYVNVMLYEINEKYNDSLIYKENPRYVTNTLDSASTFKIENIKAGKYRLLALKDNNNNYRFDPKTEKIGFYSKIISIPNDSLFEIKLFKEVEKFTAFKPSQSSGNSALVGYSGSDKEVKLTLKKGNDIVPSIVTKIPKKDSLQLWFKPFKMEKNAVDSLQLSVTKEGYNKDFTFNIKNQKADTLTIASLSKILHLGEIATLNVNIPILKPDESKILLTNKDSVAVPFKIIYDERNLKLKIDFKKEPLEQYLFTLLPDAITSFMGQTNKKKLKFPFETKNTSDYGNLRVNLENIRQFPVIVELTDKNGEVQLSYVSESETQIDFNLIKPEIYTLRVIYDENKNGIWDAGNFLEKRQSEEVIYFPKDIDVRANWDVQQTFSLK